MYSINVETMDFPKIKISDGTEDPVNVVFEGVELSEIEAVLLEEGWRGLMFSNKAFLEGHRPDIELQYMLLDEIIRFHIRLFRYRGLIVGNIHLDVVPIERIEDIFRVLMGRPHKSNHVIGVDYLSGLFLRRGYIVEVKKEPLFAKIFKSRTQ
jgi:hypothetical protein